VDSKSTSTNFGLDECDCGVKVTGGNHSYYCSSITIKPGEEFKIEYKWVYPNELTIELE
jgi:hypothetical protein